VPENSCDFWVDRFAHLDIKFESPVERFGKQVLSFKDPDGLTLELVEDSRSDKVPAWTQNDVPEKYAIRGFWGATFRLTEIQSTVDILTEVFGFNNKGEDQNLTLLQTDSLLGHSILLELAEKPIYGRNGKGKVHHVAFSA
jgi:glyoxalase family protein